MRGLLGSAVQLSPGVRGSRVQRKRPGPGPQRVILSLQVQWPGPKLPLTPRVKGAETQPCLSHLRGHGCPPGLIHADVVPRAGPHAGPGGHRGVGCAQPQLGQGHTFLRLHHYKAAPGEEAAAEVGKRPGLPRGTVAQEGPNPLRTLKGLNASWAPAPHFTLHTLPLRGQSLGSGLQGLGGGRLKGGVEWGSLQAWLGEGRAFSSPCPLASHSSVSATCCLAEWPFLDVAWLVPFS